MRVEGLNFSTGNEPTEEELDSFFDNLADYFNKHDKGGIRILDPKKMDNMVRCVKRIKDMLSGQDVTIIVTPISEPSGLGNIRILGDEFVVFKDTECLSEICRLNRGIDISALNSGKIEVVIGFETTTRIGKG